MNLGIIVSKFVRQTICNNIVRNIRIKQEPHTEYELKTTPNILYRPFLKKSNIGSPWLKYNEVIYSPRNEGPERPAEITGESLTNAISIKNLHNMAKMTCGLSVEEALKQLYFRKESTARLVEELIQKLVNDAIDQQIVEFPTNLWIESAHVTRGRSVPRIRHSQRRTIQIGNYHYADLRIRLREGKPPAVYHPNQAFSGYEAMDDALTNLRSKRIFLGL